MRLQPIDQRNVAGGQRKVRTISHSFSVWRFGDDGNPHLYMGIGAEFGGGLELNLRSRGNGLPDALENRRSLCDIAWVPHPLDRPAAALVAYVIGSLSRD